MAQWAAAHLPAGPWLPTQGDARHRRREALCRAQHRVGARRAARQCCWSRLVQSWCAKGIQQLLPVLVDFSTFCISSSCRSKGVLACLSGSGAPVAARRTLVCSGARRPTVGAAVRGSGASMGVGVGGRAARAVVDNSDRDALAQLPSHLAQQPFRPSTIASIA